VGPKLYSPEEFDQLRTKPLELTKYPVEIYDSFVFSGIRAIHLRAFLKNTGLV
jgi:hypothetical protein